MQLPDWSVDIHEIGNPRGWEEVGRSTTTEQLRFVCQCTFIRKYAYVQVAVHCFIIISVNIFNVLITKMDYVSGKGQVTARLAAYESVTALQCVIVESLASLIN